MAESFTAGGVADQQGPGTGDNGQRWDPNGGPDGKGAWISGPSGPGFGANGFAGDTKYNPRTGVAEFGDNPTLGDVQDPRSWGGVSGKVIIGPDGKPMVDPSDNGRARDVKRFQGVADAAANREAFHMDYGKGDADRARSQQTAYRQIGANAMLGNAAHGNAPSGAEMRGNAATDDALGSAMQAQAGARGVTGQAAATAGAGGALRSADLGIADHYGGARSAELNAARTAYSQGGAVARAGNYSQQALDQQRERAKMGNQLTQDQLNQNRQLGYEGLAYDTNHGAMEQGLHDDARDAGQKVTDSGRDTRASDRLASFYNQTTQAAASSGKNGSPEDPPQGG